MLEAAKAFIKEHAGEAVIDVAGKKIPLKRYGWAWRVNSRLTPGDGKEFPDGRTEKFLEDIILTEGESADALTEEWAKLLEARFGSGPDVRVDVEGTENLGALWRLLIGYMPE